MPIPPKILILDSGAGCLSIAKEIAQLNPHVNITCFADIAAFPYGSLSDELMVERQINLVAYLAPLIQPDLVVVACNTASTVALDALRNNFRVPFIGVVPAIKPAVQLTRSGSIGVLATPATVKRQYTQQLITEYAKHTEVHLHGSGQLVLLAEQYVVSGHIDPQILMQELELLRQKSTKPIDVVVLACTHFPLLKEAFSGLEPLSAMQWVDSGQAIAQRVRYWLQELNLPSYGEPSQTIEFRFSGGDPSRGSAYAKYVKRHFSSHRYTHTVTHIDTI